MAHVEFPSLGHIVLPETVVRIYNEVKWLDHSNLWSTTFAMAAPIIIMGP